jgi:hypothetical protein
MKAAQMPFIFCCMALDKKETIPAKVDFEQHYLSFPRRQESM